jgi:hypothetical protein
MKSIVLFPLLLSLVFKSDCENKGPFGEYKVEFFNDRDESYTITFRENDYHKINAKGETVGKGEITKHLRENGEGIIHLRDYAIYIPSGNTDGFVYKSLSTDYTEFYFTKKDTIQFGIHHENSHHICFKVGIMIKIRE